jgi:hypothetical protein
MLKGPRDASVAKKKLAEAGGEPIVVIAPTELTASVRSA